MLYTLEMNTTAPTQTEERPFKQGRIISHFLFGVFLPAFALGFEIVTGLSDEIFINPIPTMLHATVVGIVPCIIALHIVRLARRQSVKQIDLYINSICMAITAVYSVIYIPISPFAAMGIAFYGLGLLPLSPLIALLCTYRLRKEMKRRIPFESRPKTRHFFIGFSLGLALLGITSVPRLITDYAMSEYAKSSTDDDTSAIRLLRTFGSEKVLLKACYRQNQQIFFWGNQRTQLDTTEAHKLFYRVTGESFNSQRRIKDFMPIRGGSQDQDLGGEHIGQRIEEIQLEESRLDGILDPTFGIGYVEWTMVFRNDHQWSQQEARMLISMPKGGVGSRVTLWVNGEPREAAFGSKAKVRAAYQQVAVRQRRDPILVNWAGPDLLLAQCFPIPPQGGTMKVRIGMSFPLEAVNDTLTFRYPAIVAENFSVADEFKHSVWYEEKTTDETYSHPVVDMTTTELRLNEGRILRKTTPFDTPFTSTHPTNTARALTMLTKRPSEQSIAGPKAIVIDGSKTMRTQAEKIATWLSKQAEELEVFFASDEVLTFTGNGPACAEWIQQQTFIGGQGNVPALVDAARTLQPLATAQKAQSVYWFSGPQPIQLRGTENIRQLFERRALNLDIVACLTSRDYNALYELAPLSYSDARYLNDEAELSASTLSFATTETDLATTKGSSHAHRIWLAEQTRERANETYRQQAKLGHEVFRQQIAQFAEDAASAYLVTQLSGAVVLETDRQYKENDLEAGDPNAVPTVPEAKHYALILGICSLTWIGVQRRRYRDTR